MMAANYIITEGKFDAKFIRALLPDDLRHNIKVVPGYGYTASLSLARSILSRSNAMIIYIVDAHSNDLIDFRGKEDFIDQYFQAVASAHRYTVFVQKPELEILFFEKSSIIEGLVGRKISKAELELARLSPKQYLLEWLDLEIEDKEKILDLLTPILLEKLRELTFSKKLFSKVKKTLLLNG